MAIPSGENVIQKDNVNTKMQDDKQKFIHVKTTEYCIRLNP